jgi:hypothetical protein
MTRIPAVASAALVFLWLALLAASTAHSATYQGRNVDGKRYQGSVLNNDYGLIDDVEIKFHGDHAYVYLHGGGRLVLILDEEEIVDPHRIPASDIKRGIVWEINVKDLVGR